MDSTFLNPGHCFLGIFYARVCGGKYGQPISLFSSLRYETSLQRYGHNHFHFPRNFGDFWLLDSLEYGFRYLDDHLHHNLSRYLRIYSNLHSKYRSIGQNQLCRPVYNGLRRPARRDCIFVVQTYVRSGRWNLKFMNGYIVNYGSLFYDLCCYRL